MHISKWSVMEAVANTIGGMITGFTVQLIFFPILGINASLSQNWIMTLIFTTVSFFRSYGTRRFFVWYKKKKKKEHHEN